MHIILLCVFLDPKGCQWNISSRDHSVAESEVFEIKCDFDYASKWWTPVIRCLPDTPAEVGSNLYFSHTKTVVITAMSQLNNVKINCHIVPPSNISSSSVNDLPADKLIHLWTSPAINVKCKFGLIRYRTSSTYSYMHKCNSA